MLLTWAAIASTASASQGAQTAASSTDARAQDMAAIQKLHEQDVAATLAGDVVAIAELWTDDIVLIEQGQSPQIGKQAIVAARQRRQAAAPGFRVSRYTREIKSITIEDGWAVVSSVITGSYVVGPGADETHLRARLLTVLKKQADGSWKAAIGISNSEK